MKRREFFKNSVLTAGLGMAGLPFAASSVGAPPKARAQKFPAKFVDYGGTPAQKHLTYYNYESQAWFRKNNTVLTAYRANAAQKYPYWYPLAGPASGLSLVAETSAPWPHHRGVFFGCDRVNKGNYWQNQLRDGQIKSRGFVLTHIDETSATFTDSCLWAKPGQAPIIEDKRRHALRLLDERRYVLDSWFEVKALVDVTIERSNHALFGVRSSPDISATGGGTLLASTGAKGEKEIFGKVARWCAFYGKRAGLDITEGVAVLVPDGLKEPFGNQKWFVRDYGNMSPMPMNFLGKAESIRIPKGETVKLRYRVVAFVGTPEEAGINALWEEFNAKKA
ncbi:MAG: PmoA family protein [Puniceicoccales bacterium]|jgi:hypothetical protein|nr:PmoA family protein [Puniceicoccales bacterium]